MAHEPDPVRLSLDERVLSTLHELPGEVTFSGLRRVLGAHPESLSRALHRLARDGRVQKLQDGYRALVDRPSRPDTREPALRPIARLSLPTAVGPSSTVGRLAGRWFGGLRWVGLLRRKEGELLAWASRTDGDLVFLNVQPAALEVLATQPPGQPGSARVEESAYELLSHVLQLLREPVEPVEQTFGVHTFLLLPPPSPEEN